MLAIPEVDVRDSRCNTLTRYQYLNQLVQQFWHRWKNEYLTGLQKRSKWKYETGDAVKVGDLVVLKEDNLPPLKWALGRVVSVFPGRDNKVRVVEVKTSNGSFRRATSKICVLSLE